MKVEFKLSDGELDIDQDDKCAECGKCEKYADALDAWLNDHNSDEPYMEGGGEALNLATWLVRFDAGYAGTPIVMMMSILGDAMHQLLATMYSYGYMKGATAQAEGE